MHISILYEDDDLIIVDKPSGLLCVPGLSDPDNLHDRVLTYHKNARVVHRLDMATSGLVIFALNHEAQKRLSKMFEHKTIQKRYIAVVAGNVSENEGEIMSPLICDWESRPKQKVDWLSGKWSHTQYQVLERKNNSSRICLTPHTGRTHQLRVHMEQLGHPIFGDQLYCHPGINDRADRLLLHAKSLVFTQPITQKPISVILEPSF